MLEWDKSCHSNPTNRSSDAFRVFADLEYAAFSLLKRRRSPKIAEMPKEVACRVVVEMWAGLGRIIKKGNGRVNDPE